MPARSVAASRASTPPEDVPQTAAEPPAACSTASKSSISRATLYPGASPLSPRPRRSYVNTVKCWASSRARAALGPLRAVDPQRQVRAAHRLSPRDVCPHEERLPNLDARVQDRFPPVGWDAGLIRLVLVCAHHRDLAAEVLFVEPKCGCAGPGIVDIDVELHFAAPDRQLRVALVLPPNDEQSGGKSTGVAPT